MSYKQIFLTFDKEMLEKAREKCNEEKRSINSLFRKLYDDLPDNKVFLQELGNRFKNLSPVSLATKNAVNLTLRFPEDEFWEARTKANQSKMMIKEFSICLLETWLNNELGSILNQVDNAVDLNLLEKKDVFRRAS